MESQTIILILWLAVGFTVGKDADTTVHIEGIAGETLSLPCLFAVPPNDRVAVILWYRDGQSDAVFTYDARNGFNDLQQTGPLEIRASFHESPSPHLSLSRSSLSDAGAYDCRVDFYEAPSHTTHLQVDVIEIPRRMFIKNTAGEMVDFSLTKSVGESLILNCIVEGGYPLPRVWWTMDGHQIDSSTEQQTDQSSINKLSFPLQKRELHRSQLSCLASNTNQTQPLRHHITLLLNTPPLEVRISSVPLEMHPGRTYRILCTVKGSRPPPIITWKIAPLGAIENTLKKQDLSVGNDTKSWLSIGADFSLNDATLTCNAISPEIPSVVVTNSTTLNVVFAPRLHLALGKPLQPDSIKEGIDVYFKCSMTSNPPVSVIKWYHNKQEILHDPQKGVVVSDEHLALQRVTRKWSGIFECRASNAIGASSSQPLEVTVQFAPVCRDSTISVRSSLGKQIQVPCNVIANPSDVSFEWSFLSETSQEKNISVNNSSWSGLKATLQYTPYKLEDYGTVECWASNAIGRQRIPCLINVKQSKIERPLNCSVKNQTRDTVEIYCNHKNLEYMEHDRADTIILEETFSPSPHKTDDKRGPKEKLAELTSDSDLPKYLVFVKDHISGKMVSNMTGKGDKILVTGLTPGHDYSITVSWLTNHGKSAEVTLDALTLRTAENRMRETHDTHNLVSWFIGIAGVIIILASVVFAIAIRGKTRRPDQDSATLQPQIAEEELLSEAIECTEPEKAIHLPVDSTLIKNQPISDPDILSTTVGIFEPLVNATSTSVPKNADELLHGTTSNFQSSVNSTEWNRGFLSQDSFHNKLLYKPVPSSDMSPSFSTEAYGTNTSHLIRQDGQKSSDRESFL